MRQHGVTGTRERPAGGHGEEDHVALAALVRQMMADCRARLAAEDAAHEVVHPQQVAEGDMGERRAAD